MAKQSQNEIDQMIQRSQYKNRHLIRRDIIQVIQSSKCNLVLNLVQYNTNDGKSKEYLCLNGTVICQYKGNIYNIPIEINLNENHPYEPPIVRVKPTSNMYISSTNKDVQLDGTIICNYLQKWRHPNSDLSYLINEMSQSFSQSPPVYSASNLANQSTPYPINNQSLMPMPMGRNSSYVYPSIEREIPQEIYRESLKSSLLNKIENRYKQIIEIKQGEIDFLNKNEQNLNDSFNKIQLFIQQIQQQQIQIQNYITNLKSKISEKSSLKKDNSIKYDDTIIIPIPIYKQIFQCFTEEHAIQDLLYYLSDGLKRQSISLDNYLKRVRQLSRKQFILRATMIKCRQISGLSNK